MDWFDFSLKLPITDPTWIFLLVLLIILFAPILLNKLAYSAHYRNDTGGACHWGAWFQYLGA